MSEDTKKGIDERYQSATHASSLVVIPERGGAGDMLVVAGWSPVRIGAALLRLHSEWDGSQKPPRLPEHSIQMLAGAIAVDEMNADGKKPARGDDPPRITAQHLMKARQQAAEWLLHEQKILMGRLKTLPEVRRELVLWAARSNIEDHETIVAEMVIWWLNPTCHVCSGRRWEAIPGTGHLSRRPCPTCKGTGEKPLPEERDIAARHVLSYISGCVNEARMRMKKSLLAVRHAKQFAAGLEPDQPMTQNFKPKGE